MEPALILIACIAPSLAPSIPSPLNIPASTVGSVPGLLTSTIQALSQTVLLLCIIGARGKFREFSVVRPKPADFLRAAVSFAVFFSAGLLGSWISSLGDKAGTVSGPVSSGSGSMPGGVFLYLAVSALFALAIGYREELVYRIYAIGALRETGVTRFSALMVSAILFTAGHAYQGAPGIIAACLAGIALALLALKGFNLHALAWGHAAYDFFVLITRL